jgi:hypothetical protein
MPKLLKSVCISLIADCMIINDESIDVCYVKSSNCSFGHSYHADVPAA